MGSQPTNTPRSEQGLSTSRTSPITSIDERPPLLQSLPIDNRLSPPPRTDTSYVIKPDILGLLDPATPSASSREVPPNELPKMTSPVFMKRPEVREQDSKRTSEDTRNSALP